MATITDLKENLAKAQQDLVDKVLQESLDELNGMMTKFSTDLKFIIGLIINPPKEEVFSSSAVGIYVTIKLNEYKNGEEVSKKLSTTSEVILGKDISYFCDHRFGEFHLGYNFEERYIFLKYYESSGYGETGDLSIQIKSDGLVSTVTNSFYSSDPYIPEYSVGKPDGLITWMKALL